MRDPRVEDRPALLTEAKATELLLLTDEVSRDLVEAATICSAVGLSKEQFMACCFQKWDQAEEWMKEQ